ncbi:MAG: ABC transporter substrate-binding protein [Bilifractor sp.]
MKRQTVSGIVAIVVMTGIISGCGSSATASSSAGSGSSAVTSTSVKNTEDGKNSSSAEKTKVVFQTWNPGEQQWSVLESEFEKDNPNIDLEYRFVPDSDHYEKLKVDLSAGDAADVYGMQIGANYEAFRDFEADLTPYVEKQYGKNWADEYNENALSMLKADDGEYYALPLGVTYAGFAWSNDKLLDKYGLSVKENESLDDLKKVCATLRENGEYPLAIGAKDAWINIDTWMNIANDINPEKLYSAIEGKTSFEDADLVQSLKIWQDCFTNGVFQDGATGVGMYTDTTDPFEKEGTIPMYLNGSWACGAFLNTDEQSKEVYNGDGAHHTCFLIDWNNDGKAAPVQATVDVSLCLNKNSKNPDAAYQVIDWMLHKGQDILVNQLLQYCPSRTDLDLKVQGLSENGNECLNFIMDQANNNVAGYREMAYPDLKQTISDQLTSLAIGDVTPEEAAKTIQEASETQER